MGLSSNARLLSITARLTSNEYESQQVSNAKMRLATKSQEASDEYIEALNSTNYAFVSYDSEGNSINVPLSAAVLYQYGSSKNQYMLTNTAGQALVSGEDAYNYRTSANLQAFLEKYGLKASYRNTALEEYKNNMDSYADAYTNWKALVEDKMSKPEGDYTVESWQNKYSETKKNYNDKLDAYNKLVDQKASDTEDPVTDEQIKTALEELASAKDNYSNTVSYEVWVEHLLSKENENKNEYEDYLKYKTAKNNYETELQELGITADQAYTYDDSTKAQWYTNLWFRMNGESTVKNSKADNYQTLEPGLLSSTSWIKDAITHGTITIEVASYDQNKKPDIDSQMPTIMNLKGISWTPKIFTNCSDITQRDDDKAIEKAEAVYKKAMAEITAKDEKYQRKLSTLDTEHNAIQTEYESVKSALSKNIDRSFKAFQG